MLAALWERFVEWSKVDERGASMVEYALLVVLIAIIAIVAIAFAGSEVSDAFSNVAESLNSAGN